jgi:hypothetical protein
MRVRIKSDEIDVMVTEGVVDEGGRSQVGKESSADCCVAAFETIVPVRVVHCSLVIHCALAEHSRATGEISTSCASASISLRGV